MSEERPLILIVDDEREVGRVVTRMLEREGFRAVLCADLAAVEAELAAGLAPDIVLCDWVLVSTTGRRVALEIRRQRPGVPVVFMTGLEASDLGEPVITKPFVTAELVAKVRRVLEAGTADVLLADITREEASYTRRPDVSGQMPVVKVDAQELEQARERFRRPRRPS